MIDEARMLADCDNWESNSYGSMILSRYVRELLAERKRLEVLARDLGEELNMTDWTCHEMVCDQMFARACNCSVNRIGNLLRQAKVRLSE